jgi:hypothetical protein
MSQVVPDSLTPRLRQYIRERRGEERGRLWASDFPLGRSVVIRFPDGSQVLFRCAFAIADKSAREVVRPLESHSYGVAREASRA